MKKENSQLDGFEIKCAGCKRVIAKMAKGVYGEVSLKCPWCGCINRKQRKDIPWSEIWKKET